MPPQEAGDFTGGQVRGKFLLDVTSPDTIRTGQPGLRKTFSLLAAVLIFKTGYRTNPTIFPFLLLTSASCFTEKGGRKGEITGVEGVGGETETAGSLCSGCLW